MLYPKTVKMLRFSHYLLIKGDIFVLDDDKYPQDPRLTDYCNHTYAVEDRHGHLYASVDFQTYVLRPLAEIDPPTRKLQGRRCFVSAGAAEKPDVFELFDDPVATGQRATIHEQQRFQDCPKTVYPEKEQFVDVWNRNMRKLQAGYHSQNQNCSIP